MGKLSKSKDHSDKVSIKWAQC